MEDPKTYFAAGKDQAALYKTYRMPMQPDVLDRIIGYLGEKFEPRECVAADVGCGSGQATLPLSAFLRFVTGIDPSFSQIEEARNNVTPSNVQFVIGDAEELPFEDSSLHMINVSSALHWFRVPEFFAEVDRVLKPGGILVVTCNGGRPQIVGHEGEEQEAIYESILGQSMTETRNKHIQLVRDQYRDVQFPYPSERHVICRERKVHLDYIMGLVKTFSGMVKLIQENPTRAESFLQETQSSFMKLVGVTKGKPEEIEIKVRTSTVLILCRKPAAMT